MSAPHDQVQRADYDQVMFPNYAPATFVPVRAEGSRVWDQAGREFIDFTGGIAVNALGHCHPALVAALTEQAGQLWHISNVFTNEPALRLARKLVESTFAERVFFCNSGAEANEAALKLARRAAHDRFGPEKYEIVAALNSFHGRTLFTVNVGGQAKYSDGFGPKVQGVTHVPYNDMAALEAAVSERTCAVILEPIQGEGGILPGDKAYLERARELCNRHDALLIFDEVQTGMGRSGQLYAYMNYDVVPDVLSSAKGLGGGFPIGAILTTEALAKHFAVGVHGTTFGGNPLACAVAEAVLDVVRMPETLAGVRERHEQFKQQLEALGRKYGLFSHVRGLGLLIGCVLSDAWKGKSRDVLLAAEAESLMVLQAGPDVVRFAPSLIIDHADIAEGMARFERAVAKLANAA
jgi:acetylornithine/N-succinyldiaminopimelate aminotransferase